MKTYTKQELIDKLISITEIGWVKSGRHGNAGGVGNTLEDLLEIKENNLPIPNAAEWELKCHRIGSSSLTTLFHMEPSPRSLNIVPSILLPKYGWRHKLANDKYSEDEMSFRLTINALGRSDRGFTVVINNAERKVMISFDSKSVDIRHSKWLKSVEKRVGLGELNPQPYWGFDDLFHKAGTKLLNCFYVEAQSKIEDGIEYFKYEKIKMLSKFSLEKLIQAIIDGLILVDFDARTGHNHGTKFRFKLNRIGELYENEKVVL
ncbi:MvaI/BcnI restriction endonuclease family protein [Candidatus Collierbacteria bacterium]|nr:MvaI/BcnI restriction endonuclease family protein [Candidatus Collierbacteria bacterium]